MIKKFIALMLSVAVGGSISLPSVHAMEMKSDIVQGTYAKESVEGYEIEFQSDYEEDEGFEVTSLKGYKLKDGVKLVLECSSEEKRSFSLFNPPSGDVVMKLYGNKIKAGDNEIAIYLNDEEVEGLIEEGEMTMKFMAGKNYSYIFTPTDVFEEFPLDNSDSVEGSLSSDEINFQTESVKDKDFEVKYIKGYKVKNGVRLMVNCTSPNARDFSIFNPPNGNILMKVTSNGIKKGENNLVIDIKQSDLDKLKDAGTLTMKFGFKKNHTFAFFDLDQFKNLPVKEGIEIQDKKELIDFNTQSIKDEQFKVESLKAYTNDKGIKFVIECNSPDKRDMSIFNPPNGKKIMKTYKNKIKQGKNNIVIQLNKSEYKKIMESKELTMKFGFNEKKTTFIYFNTGQLTTIPSENQSESDKPVKPEKPEKPEKPSKPNPPSGDDDEGTEGKISIPDKIFADKVKDLLPGGSKELTAENLALLTELSLPSSGIKDLTGLEHMVNLRKVNVSDNKITRVPSLSKLTRLTHFDIGKSGIKDISNIVKASNITNLYIYNNNIDNHEELSKLTKMEHLCMGRTTASNIDFVKNMNNLKYLEIQNNPNITSLEPLKSVASLQGLIAQSCYISDISPLAGKTQLTSLFIGNNNIKDFSPIKDIYNNIKDKDFQM
ncbi:MAG: leucine-rich repeat domain-containing protein [Clostridium sp.]